MIKTFLIYCIYEKGFYFFINLSVPFVIGKEGQWMWLHSDTNLTDSFWGPDAPNHNTGNTEDCAVMIVKTDNFWWQDTNCLAPEVQHKIVAVICQYDTNDAFTTVSTQESTTTTEVTPIDNCPDGWEEFEEHCYQYRAENVTWSEANADCILAGGHLSSVHSQAENDFISIFNGIHYIWLGSSDELIEVKTSFIYSNRKGLTCSNLQ